MISSSIWSDGLKIYMPKLYKHSDEMQLSRHYWIFKTFSDEMNNFNCKRVHLNLFSKVQCNARKMCMCDLFTRPHCVCSICLTDRFRITLIAAVSQFLYVFDSKNCFIQIRLSQFDYPLNTSIRSINEQGQYMLQHCTVPHSS